MALVSARPVNTSGALEQQSTQQDQDPDFARAETLLQLHQTVKLAYASGSNAGHLSDEFRDLREMRTQVHQVLQQLNPTNDHNTQVSTWITHDNDDDETEAWS